jgi:hypothetical protein
MPVRKYRSVEEMNQPIWYPVGSTQLAEAIRRVWQFGHRTTRRRFRPGVHRFTSIEDMQAAAARIVIDGR